MTGLCLNGGKLFHLGKEVESGASSEAYDEFSSRLETFDQVILVALNGRHFDFPILCPALESANLKDRFCNSVLGCVDSLPVFRKKI